MKGSGFAIRGWIAVMLLLSVPISASSQEGRGVTGLPPYIKSPADRPPFEGIEPATVGPNRTTEAILATISPRDSVIVINGKVNMGGRDYFSVYPIFRGGSLYGAMTACEKEFMMRPQYKAKEREGYTMLVVVKDTATDPDCWKQFRNLDTVDLSCDQLMVKTAEWEEPVAWENPYSTYANSYDLRTFGLGPINPK